MSGNDTPIMIYTTFPSRQEAENAGRALVEHKLAACINILPAMTSIYAWEGAIERAEEVVMLVKTRQEHQLAIEQELTRQHPYDVPTFLIIEVSSGSKAYLAWLNEQTSCA